MDTPLSSTLHEPHSLAVLSWPALLMHL
eukprot:COSAG02_NODE_73208_length_175_cov_24.473684_1_plen_27_part_01